MSNTTPTTAKSSDPRRWEPSPRAEDVDLLARQQRRFMRQQVAAAASGDVGLAGIFRRVSDLDIGDGR